MEILFYQNYFGTLPNDGVTFSSSPVHWPARANHPAVRRVTPCALFSLLEIHKIFHWYKVTNKPYAFIIVKVVTI